MTRRRKIIMIAAALVFLIGTAQGIRKYPDMKADLLEHLRRGEIYNLSGVEKVEGFHAKMDTLMAFVHNNSVHNIDEEFWNDFRNKPRTLDKFLSYAKGQSKDRPHMECSTRCKLMMPLVRRAGYDAHMVDIFKHDAAYNSHVVLEVKNPENGMWEVYDPTFQIYWKNEKTGERASMGDLVFSEEFHFIPCHDENRCGYKRADHGYPPDKSMLDYFGYAVLMNDEGQGETVLNNKSRFDPAQKPEGADKLFCDWGGKRWCP
jgi:hypothetical protein